MTTLTMRYIKGDFVVTGPDIERVKFVMRRAAKNWCAEHHPGSPIKEIGPDRVTRSLKCPTRKGK
jgi:hypothetical protein